MRSKPEVVTYIEKFRQRGNDEKYISDIRATLPADYWKRWTKQDMNHEEFFPHTQRHRLARDVMIMIMM